MLLPELSAARERARASNCVNQLKQQGVATHLYCADYNDFLPTRKERRLGNYLTQGDNDYAIALILGGYMGGDERGSLISKAKNFYEACRKYFCCPSDPGDPTGENSAEREKSFYYSFTPSHNSGYISYFVFFMDDATIKRWYMPDGEASRLLGRRTLTGGDTDPGNVIVGDYSVWLGKESLIKLHPAAGNVLALDGSVKSVSYDGLPAGEWAASGTSKEDKKKWFDAVDL